MNWVVIAVIVWSVLLALAVRDALSALRAQQAEIARLREDRNLEKRWRKDSDERAEIAEARRRTLEAEKDVAQEQCASAERALNEAWKAALPAGAPDLREQIAQLAHEMRAIQITAGQCSLEGPDDLSSRLAAAEAERLRAWADRLEALVHPDAERE